MRAAKLFEAHQFNGSEIAAQAVALIAKLYEVEREARELGPDARWMLRQRHAKPVAEALHAWLSEQHQKLAKADVTAKAINYSLNNWRGLTHYLDYGHVQILCWIAAGRRARRRGAQPDRIGQTQTGTTPGLT